MISLYQQIARKSLPRYSILQNGYQLSRVNELQRQQSYSFSLEKKKQQQKMSKMMHEAKHEQEMQSKKEYKKTGQLYPDAHKEYSQLSEETVKETPSELWKSLLLLQLPQVFYLYSAATSEYYSFSFSNNLGMLVDSACLSMALLGGMYYGYAMLKKESYHFLLTPFTLICLGASMHFAYNLNTFCFIPIYLAQLIQTLADYQGSSSKRYPNYILSMKSRYFMLNFIITLLGFFVMQGFQNYNTKMIKMKEGYEQQNRELAQPKQKSTNQQ